jgi:hypothetical protein
MYTGSLPANRESYHNGYWLSVEDGKTGRQSRVVSRDRAISPKPIALYAVSVRPRISLNSRKLR